MRNYLVRHKYFPFDLTPACGYSVDSQIELYQEIQNNFTNDGKTQMVVVMNKKDLASTNEIEYLKRKLQTKNNEFFLTNAMTGENLDKLIAYLKDKY